MKYETIKQIEGNLGKTNRCQTLGVDLRGYDNWLEQRPSKYTMKLRDRIEKIAIEFPYYGYRRITITLQRIGFKTNHKRVLRIMREDSLLCAKKKLFRPQTTDSNHNYLRYPNLIKGIKISRINQVWASDITYIQLPNEFVYLAAVIDLFSRRCIGWCLSRSLESSIAVRAMEMALKIRKGTDLAGLIHHSDQGVQYACTEYVEMLTKLRIRISMSRKANPYDNAFAESFMKTLKYEEVLLSEYETFEEAYRNIMKFIEDVYNKKRLHSGIGYLSPIEFENGITLKGGKRNDI